MANFETKIKTFFTQNRDGFEFDAYTSIGAQISLEARAKVSVEKQISPKKIERFQLIEPAKLFTPRKILCSMELNEVVEIGKRLTEAYMTTDYRRILLNPYWMQLFNVKNRDFDYIEGTTLRTSSEASLPCHNCGILLPSSHITIDHRKPQAGGEEQAILKVLRGLAFYLTMLPGHGNFATAYFQGTTEPLPTRVGKEQKFSSDYERERRYTLTDRGMTVLSVLVASTNLQTVVNACLHSAFNLRPYCAKCNTAKSNDTTDLTWIN